MENDLQTKPRPFETKNWTNTQYSILNGHILLRWNKCAHFTVNCTYIGAVNCIYTADKHVILSVFFFHVELTGISVQ